MGTTILIERGAAVEKPPDREIISSDEGSRINGLLRDLITKTGAEIALLVRTEGALIARAGKMDEIEDVGMLAALVYGAAQSIAASFKTSVSYIHQHGDRKDLLILGINGQSGLVVAFKGALGLGGILYNARQTAAALCELLRS